MLEIRDIVAQLPRKPGHPYWKTRTLESIKKIVVHYDAVKVPPVREGGGIAYDPVKRYIAQAQYHINKNWNEGRKPVVRGFGLMYHYGNNTAFCVSCALLHGVDLSIDGRSVILTPKRGTKASRRRRRPFRRLRSRHGRPRTPVAKTKFKKVMVKSVEGVAESFKSILVSVLTETAKRLIWP